MTSLSDRVLPSNTDVPYLSAVGGRSRVEYDKRSVYI